MFTLRLFSNHNTNRFNSSSFDAETDFFARKAKYGTTSSSSEEKASLNYEANELKELTDWQNSLFGHNSNEKESA